MCACPAGFGTSHIRARPARSAAVVAERAWAMSDARPAKLAKLQSLRQRLKQLSQSALAAVLKVAQVEPLPDAASARTIRDARDEAVRQADVYGSLHQTVDVPLTTQHGGLPANMQLEIAAPQATLREAARQSAALSALIAHAVATAPPSIERPWRIMLYMDEILPGNQLAHKHARKLWTCYWSFIEFGGAALAHEALWDVRYTDNPLYSTPMAAAAAMGINVLAMTCMY